MNLRIVIGMTLVLAGTSLAFGQVEYPSLSPKGRMIQIARNTGVEIEYEHPSVRKTSDPYQS